MFYKGKIQNGIKKQKEEECPEKKERLLAQFNYTTVPETDCNSNYSYNDSTPLPEQ